MIGNAPSPRTSLGSAVLLFFHLGCGPEFRAPADVGPDAPEDPIAEGEISEVPKPEAAFALPAGRPAAEVPSDSEFDVRITPDLTVGDLLEHFAPVWYHDTDTGGPDGALGALQDYYMPYDFDGDHQHNNNWEGLAQGFEVNAVIYAAVRATASHYYLTFSQYHARDWEQICTGLFTECHEGDMESVHMVVERDASGFGRPIILLTGAHGRTSIWINPDAGLGVEGKGSFDFESADGDFSDSFDSDHTHVRLYTQERGHGPIACRARTVEPFGGYFGFGPNGVRCMNAPYDEGFRDGNGIVFRYRNGEATPFAPGMETTNAEVDYAFLSYRDDMWPYRFEIGPGLLWSDKDAHILLYTGGRGPPFVLDDPIGSKFDPKQFPVENSGDAAWRNALDKTNRGDLFFDPAYAFTTALELDPPLDDEYTYHPYLFPGLSPF